MVYITRKTLTLTSEIRGELTVIQWNVDVSSKNGCPCALWWKCKKVNCMLFPFKCTHQRNNVSFHVVHGVYYKENININFRDQGWTDSHAMKCWCFKQNGCPCALWCKCNKVNCMLFPFKCTYQSDNMSFLVVHGACYKANIKTNHSDQE